MNFFKSTERNRLSYKEPSDIAERSSISSATESVQIVSIKHGLRTGYKIRTRYKTRTTD